MIDGLPLYRLHEPRMATVKRIPTLFLLLALTPIVLARPEPRQTNYPIEPVVDYVQLGGFDFYIRIPLALAEQATFFDNTVYFDKGRHIQTKLVGKRDLQASPEVTLSASDFVKLMFNLEMPQPVTDADREFLRQADNIKITLLQGKSAPLFG